MRPWAISCVWLNVAILEEYLSKLCSELSIALTSENEQRVYPLKMNNDTTIQIQEFDPGVFFQADITECPKDHLEELLTYLMRANLLGQGTGSSVIGLDEKEKYLTLSLCLPYEMNYRVFRENLEDFVNYLSYWRDEIEDLRKKAAQKLI